MRKKLIAPFIALFALTSVAVSGLAAGASPPTRQDREAWTAARAMSRTSTTPGTPRLARQLSQMRVATAKYATDLDAATADGYRIITQMIPDMGYHYMNPDIVDFDVTRPPILVYQHDAATDTWILGALEWVFPEAPASRRSGARPTARSGRPVTTTTARSSSRRTRRTVRPPAPRAGRRSCSGTRTS